MDLNKNYYRKIGELKAEIHHLQIMLERRKQELTNLESVNPDLSPLSVLDSLLREAV